MLFILIPLILATFMVGITIITNIYKFKKQGFLYYLPKNIRFKPLRFWKKIDISECVKITQTDDPERFNKHIKRSFFVALLYFIIVLAFIVIFLLI